MKDDNKVEGKGNAGTCTEVAKVAGGGVVLADAYRSEFSEGDLAIWDGMVKLGEAEHRSKMVDMVQDSANCGKWNTKAKMKMELAGGEIPVSVGMVRYILARVNGTHPRGIFAYCGISGWGEIGMWKVRCPAFRYAFEQLTNGNKEYIRELAYGTMTEVLEGGEVDKQRVSAASWALERLDRDSFADPKKKCVGDVVGGAIGGGITINLIAPDSKPMVKVGDVVDCEGVSV